MRALRVVLAVKLALTVGLWAGPLLLAPVGLFEALGFPEPRPVLFVRLLGVAYAALAVGYARGLAEARCGRVPATVVWVGVASNGGAAAVLALGLGAWTGWGTLAQAYLWTSLVAAAAVTVGLLASGRRAEGA